MLPSTIVALSQISKYYKSDDLLYNKDMSEYPIPYKVGFLLIEGFALMSFSAVVEPLRAANLLSNKTLYQLNYITEDNQSSSSTSGAKIEATKALEDTQNYDLIMVIAGSSGVSTNSPKILSWLRTQAAMGAVLGGISAGGVVLATAGLMSGKRMTAHWEHLPTLAELYPNLLIEKTLYVIDRDRMTSAGGTAPLDMMHSLIASHHGTEFAQKVSDWFMHTEVRPAGGPQRAGLVERYGTTNPMILNCIDAMRNHIADPLDLSQLAALIGLSSRQLNRLFHQKFDQPTMHFYRMLRLEKANNLLIHSPLTITEIALATGFANSAHFARLYMKAYGKTPSASRP
jgi:transcriptional regulator GlxA family with amidase domain